MTQIDLSPRHDRFPDAVLSTREQEVVDAVVRGLRSREIAEVLGISVVAVESRIRQALRKLGLRRRTALALLYAGVEPPAAPPVVDRVAEDERLLLMALAEGSTVGEAAGVALMSPRTAERRLHRLRTELGATTTTQVIRLVLAPSGFGADDAR